MAVMMMMMMMMIRFRRHADSPVEANVSEKHTASIFSLKDGEQDWNVSQF
jgi:hypothetical protein